MKKTFAFLLSFLAVCLSITLYAQSDTLMVPLPVEGGGDIDWKGFLSTQVISAIAIFVTKNVTMGLTTKFKEWMSTHGKFTIYINIAVNALVIAAIYGATGKFTTWGQAAAYLATVIICALRDNGMHQLLVNTSAVGTDNARLR